MKNKETNNISFNFFENNIDDNKNTTVFLVKKDTNKIELVEYQYYYPDMCGTCINTTKYGIITLMQKDSYRNLVSSSLNDNEFHFLEKNSSDVNVYASMIATSLDIKIRHTILGDCYFIFEEIAPSLEDFKNIK